MTYMYEHALEYIKLHEEAPYFYFWNGLVNMHVHTRAHICIQTDCTNSNFNFTAKMDVANQNGRCKPKITNTYMYTDGLHEQWRAHASHNWKRTRLSSTRGPILGTYSDRGF